jgi:hypothetical protein
MGVSSAFIVSGVVANRRGPYVTYKLRCVIQTNERRYERAPTKTLSNKWQETDAIARRFFHHPERRACALLTQTSARDRIAAA